MERKTFPHAFGSFDQNVTGPCPQQQGRLRKQPCGLSAPVWEVGSDREKGQREERLLGRFELGCL